MYRAFKKHFFFLNTHFGPMHFCRFLYASPSTENGILTKQISTILECIIWESATTVPTI